MSGPVLTSREGAVALVTINRPAAMNALDTAAKDALLAALGVVAADPGVRAVVLTGDGERAFCAGQDLREHAALLAAQSAEEVFSTVEEHYAPIATLLLTMPKPVVAAVNGVAAGAGAAFAFACDLRIVASHAGFNLAFTAVGLSADSSASWTLPRLVGVARAKELLLLPRTVPADEALGLGLATRVVPAADVLPEAMALAAALAAGPTAAYAAVRRAVEFSAGHGLGESLAYEAEQMRLAGGTADHRRAVEAFGRKEKPTFEGR